jgi:hypothetical protein
MLVMLSGSDGSMTNICTIAAYAIIAVWNSYLCMLAGHHGWFSWIYWMGILDSLSGFAGWLSRLCWLATMPIQAGFADYLSAYV